MALELPDRRLFLTARGMHKRVVDEDAILLASVGGPPTDVVASALRVGDFLAVQYGAYDWPATPAILPQLSERKLYGTEKAITVPAAMTSELAFLLGAYASEGQQPAATGRSS